MAATALLFLERQLLKLKVLKYPPSPCALVLSRLLRNMGTCCRMQAPAAQHERLPKQRVVRSAEGSNIASEQWLDSSVTQWPSRRKRD